MQKKSLKMICILFSKMYKQGVVIQTTYFIFIIG
jgi:hypothetical protein